MPEAGYVYISTIRWWGLVFLVAMVVRDIVAPRRDVVWATYGDDPDGGDFAGARDVDWNRDARIAFGDLTATLRTGIGDWVRGARAWVGGARRPRF